MRVVPLSLWNQYTSFPSSGLPTKSGRSSSTSTTTSGLAPPVLFGLGIVARKVPIAMGCREAKDERDPLFLFQPPVSTALPEKPIIEEK